MTFFSCMKVINVWLFMSSLMLIFMFGYMYLAQVLKTYNLAIDYITLSIVMWNFGVVGIIAIHMTGPLIVQQVCYYFSGIYTIPFYISFVKAYLL